jgi:hypothetical protein
MNFVSCAATASYGFAASIFGSARISSTVRRKIARANNADNRRHLTLIRCMYRLPME